MRIASRGMMLAAVAAQIAMMDGPRPSAPPKRPKRGPRPNKPADRSKKQYLLKGIRP